MNLFLFFSFKKTRPQRWVLEYESLSKNNIESLGSLNIIEPQKFKNKKNEVQRIKLKYPILNHPDLISKMVLRCIALSQKRAKEGIHLLEQF